MLLSILELLEEEERADFRKVYEDNYMKMYHAAYFMLRHAQDAENAVHDAFVKLAENWELYKSLERDKMTALCITIAKNKSIDTLRKNKRFADPEEFFVELKRPDVLLEVMENESERILMKKLDELGESLKIVLVLKYFLGYKNSEIARTLDISQRAVEMRLHRAKTRLKDALEDE